MRQILGAIALALASGLLGWVMGDRNKIMNHPDPTLYRAALYSLHVLAVDSVSGDPVTFRISWDSRMVSPFGKGSGPGRIEAYPDGSRSANLVGEPLANGLTFEISAEGYEPETAHVWGHTSGIGTRLPHHVVTVKLLQKNSGVTEGNQPGVPVPDPAR